MKLGIGLLWLGLACVAQAQSADEVRKILVSRVDEHKQAVGLVVGIVESGEKRVVVHGRRAAGDAKPLDGDTVFEIGSITKGFTGILLADMARKGEVALDDPAQKYLPEGVKMPQKGEKAITLRDLSTHRSGLPRLPSNLKPADKMNPYADYGAAQLYEFLNGHTLRREPGEAYEYSNLGAGLLGHLLARRAGKGYEALLRERVLDPLGMKDTRITLTEGMQARLAQGHGMQLEAVKNWDLDVLAGAGALRSTANDMMRLMEAMMGGKGPLAESIRMAVSERRPAAPKLAIGLGWHMWEGDREIVWHNGGTGGYRSFAGYAAKTGKAVVVLSNAAISADDIGLHLLDETRKLAEFEKEVVVEEAVLDRYVGRYELAPGAVLEVTREGKRMFAQLTGQPRFEVFAKTERRFFWKVVKAEVEFRGEGKAGELTLYQSGREIPAKRVE